MTATLGVRQKNILIIDDEKIILDSIERQLKSDNSFNITLIDNPVEGISHAVNDNFDVILCDIKMEPISGLEVMKKIKYIKPQIPIIIITGFVDDQIREEAYDLGCSDYLIKPIRKKDLLELINKTIN